MLWALASSAQQRYSGNLDPSACYSSLLRDQTKWQYDENLRYSLLTKLNREDYDYMKATGSLQVLFKGVPLAGNFEADRDTATKLVQERDERLAKDTHLLIESASLSQGAVGIMTDCIDHLFAAQAYGLFTSSLDTDPYTTILILTWHWTDGTPIKIISSTVNGGQVIETDSTGHLLSGARFIHKTAGLIVFITPGFANKPSSSSNLMIPIKM